MRKTPIILFLLFLMLPLNVFAVSLVIIPTQESSASAEFFVPKGECGASMRISVNGGGGFKIASLDSTVARSDEETGVTNVFSRYLFNNMGGTTSEKDGYENKGKQYDVVITGCGPKVETHAFYAEQKKISFYYKQKKVKTGCGSEPMLGFEQGITMTEKKPGNPVKEYTEAVIILSAPEATVSAGMGIAMPIQMYYVYDGEFNKYFDYDIDRELNLYVDKEDIQEKLDKYYPYKPNEIIKVNGDDIKIKGYKIPFDEVTDVQLGEGEDLDIGPLSEEDDGYYSEGNELFFVNNPIPGLLIKDEESCRDEFKWAMIDAVPEERNSAWESIETDTYEDVKKQEDRKCRSAYGISAASDFRQVGYWYEYQEKIWSTPGVDNPEMVCAVISTIKLTYSIDTKKWKWVPGTCFNVDTGHDEPCQVLKSYWEEVPQGDPGIPPQKIWGYSGTIINATESVTVASGQYTSACNLQEDGGLPRIEEGKIGPICENRLITKITKKMNEMAEYYNTWPNILTSGPTQTSVVNEENLPMYRFISGHQGSFQSVMDSLSPEVKDSLEKRRISKRDSEDVECEGYYDAIEDELSCKWVEWVTGYYIGKGRWSSNPGDAIWTIENLKQDPPPAGLNANPEDIFLFGERERCRYYYPRVDNSITEKIDYGLPYAYIEEGNGKVYPDPEYAKSPTVLNLEGEIEGERRLYTDLKSDGETITLSVIGTDLGVNKYVYDLTCEYGIEPNGLFESSDVIIYRPVDLNSPFPRYAPYPNWEGININELVGKSMTASLDAVTIRKIKGFNSDALGSRLDSEGYLDYNLNKDGESDFIHRYFSDIFR